MDINRMLVDLRTERDQIVDAIGVLERPCLGRGKRRGRPSEMDDASQAAGQAEGEQE